MNKLNDLIRRCKCGVHLVVNNHRDMYEKAAVYLEDWREREGDDLADGGTIAAMIRKDTIVELVFYPETPVSSCKIWHYNVEMAIDRALEIVSICEQAR